MTPLMNTSCPGQRWVDVHSWLPLRDAELPLPSLPSLLSLSPSFPSHLPSSLSTPPLLAGERPARRRRLAIHMYHIQYAKKNSSKLLCKKHYVWPDQTRFKKGKISLDDTTDLEFRSRPKIQVPNPIPRAPLSGYPWISRLKFAENDDRQTDRPTNRLK